jgi:hypothetical protein
MEKFLQDLKHSLRMFWKSPGFTMTAIAALCGAQKLRTARLGEVFWRVILDGHELLE